MNIFLAIKVIASIDRLIQLDAIRMPTIAGILGGNVNIQLLILATQSAVSQANIDASLAALGSNAKRDKRVPALAGAYQTNLIRERDQTGDLLVGSHRAAGPIGIVVGAALLFKSGLGSLQHSVSSNRHIVFSVPILKNF